MSWGAPIRRRDDSEREEWTTNEEIWAHWETFVQKNIAAKNTKRNLLVYPAVFFRSFDALVTDLSPSDFEAFVERIGTKCSKLQYGDSPACRARQPIESCPLLAADVPFESCPRYEPLLPSGTWSYITAVHRLYSWLQIEGRIGINPATKTYTSFKARHREFFDDRMRNPRRRKLTGLEVSRLTAETPMQWRIAVAFMAKCFLREHELLKLTLDPMYCSLDKGYMEIPPDYELGGKRLGNHRIIIDDELMRLTTQYLEWRDQRIRRDVDGNPVTDRFLITQFGLPWGKGAIGNFRTGLQRQCVRLNLMTGQERKSEERITTHCFRAFATSQARDRGANNSDVQVLRGDLSPGSLIRYEDYKRRLPELYSRYGPRLDL